MNNTHTTAIKALAIALALLLAPAMALGNPFHDNDLSYNFLYGSETDVYVSTLYNKSATYITIPSKVVYEFEGKDEDGNSIVKHRTCNVVAIAAGVFRDCSGLKSVTIPDSVTLIGRRAFMDCSGLTSITIGNSVTNIPDGAFSGCSGLKSVTIPDSVTSIEWDAFSNCSGLTSVTIGNSVTNIGCGVNVVNWGAFSGCSSLSSVVIPNSVTRVGNGTFSGCSGLKNVAIGNGMRSIGTNVFEGCSSLKAFSVAIDNPTFKSESGFLLTKDGKTLVYGVNGDVVIPDGVTDLSACAFRGYGELTSVVIPDSVVRLPTTAFDGCDKLWTSWYRSLANLAAGGGSSGGGSSGGGSSGGSSGGGSGGSSGGSGKTVSLTVTNVVVHYVTQSVPSGAVVPATNSTGIVNIVAEVTAGKAFAVSEEWAKQYPGFEEIYGTDFSAALTMADGKRDGTGAPMYVWQDYVAGTDPTDPASVFTASVTFDAETGEPIISWSPELSPEEADKRLYTVYGKVRMTDPEWTPLADNAADFNFFRVTVEMK